MRETRIIMGMPVTIDLPHARSPEPLESVFRYFEAVDRRFSTYKPESEISAINRGEIARDDFSPQMLEVFAIAETTRRETDGYFDIATPAGALDPSGIVKGWAIRNAAEMLLAMGITDFCLDVGGDIQCAGRNEAGEPWRIGIRNPFDPAGIVKIIYPATHGVATSGSYVRGGHIYDPALGTPPADAPVSITVIGPDILEADRFATAAIAMGNDGIAFIATRAGLEAYAIDASGIATATPGFSNYTRPQ